MNLQAGAPPDPFSAKGQNWSFPTYNWERMKQDGFSWWRRRFEQLGRYFDAYRIDHILGFFRIWSIPQNEPRENYGLNGFYDPGDESKWEAHGRRILSFILQNSRLFLCAEDLGTIPPVCTKVLAELGIPGNDVQRWTKDWVTRHDFLPPQEYRLLSATMLSTHDTTNWPAWWDYEAGTIDEALFQRKCGERGIDFETVKVKLFDPARSAHGRLRWLDTIASADDLAWNAGKSKDEIRDFIELYLNSYKEKEKLWRMLGMPGPMREKSDASLVEAVTRFTASSRSIFFLNLLNDWLYLDSVWSGDPYPKRINMPGTLQPANWSLLVPLALEALLELPVCAKIREINAAAGRSCGA
jgi:4-alpha-glucanotransferase